MKIIKLKKAPMHFSNKKLRDKSQPINNIEVIRFEVSGTLGNGGCNKLNKYFSTSRPSVMPDLLRFT